MKKKFDNLIRISLLAPFVAAMVIHGSTKPTPSTGTITYLRTDADVQYLYDAGSFVSNDLVHVSFTYAVAPGTADFQLWAWPNASTNEEEMVLVYSNTLAGVTQPYEFEYAGAISNRWFGFTTWTPGPSVHTNGVALVNWQMPFDPAATNVAAMTRTGVYFNGVRLAPNVGYKPYDAEVEYLESTGTQYIDTGKRLSSDGFGYDAVLSFNSLANCQVFSGRVDANSGSALSLSLFVVGGFWRFDYFGTSRPGPQVAINTDYAVSLANNITTVNGVAIQTPMSGNRQSGATVYVFAGHRPAVTGGVEFYSSIKLFSLKIYQNGTVVLDFQPVRKDGVGYMYDRVSGQLFGNAGTGAFIVGPDK